MHLCFVPFTAQSRGNTPPWSCCACSRRAGEACISVLVNDSGVLAMEGYGRGGLGGLEEGRLADLALDIASLCVL